MVCFIIGCDEFGSFRCIFRSDYVLYFLFVCIVVIGYTVD